MSKYVTENLSQKDIDALCGWVKEYTKCKINEAFNNRTTGLDESTDQELVFELMSRGYAVWKPPVGE